MTSATRRRLVFPVSRAQATCGVEAFARLLAEAAARRGDEVLALPLEGGRADRRAIAAALRPGDALVCNLPVVAWKRHVLAPLLALAAARRRGATATLMLHEWGDLDWKRRAMFRLYLPFADALLFSSPTVAAQLAEDAWTAPVRRRMRGALPIPPNLRPPATTADSPLAAAMRAWRQEGRFVLASFGSIYPKKQTTRLLDMLPALQRRGTQAVLVLIGSFVKGADRVEETFQAAVRARGLEGDVHVSGYVADEATLFGLFAEADAFAYCFAEGLTSRRGSVLACLQSERPVVVNAPAQAHEFTHHRAYGALLAARRLTLVPTDAGPEAYAEALLTARLRPPAAARIDFDACWDDAAEALARALDVPARDRAPTGLQGAGQESR
ncbi:glycosyltransferase [Labrys wisconsinensis]|uniref:Glycosyltransferase involved in cell wall biosynthesis n=1 Tax=Labrys wisconsinensis TaxID=425677 RepID=A0ABU0IZ38_9HYPH|nr:glycosyltransferase [Labrys wisconsinensis]MDQ0467275.1 glycosyltransferase involved in cell wall biosynthesis [Labrys wisconsinensis]